VKIITLCKERQIPIKMRKGYVLILIFSLFSAIGRTLMYRIYIKRDYADVSFNDILLRVVIAFLIFLIPGLLLVRLYYRLKDK